MLQADTAACSLKEVSCGPMGSLVSCNERTWYWWLLLELFITHRPVVNDMSQTGGRVLWVCFLGAAASSACLLYQLIPACPDTVLFTMATFTSKSAIVARPTVRPFSTRRVSTFSGVNLLNCEPIEQWWCCQGAPRCLECYCSAVRLGAAAVMNSDACAMIHQAATFYAQLLCVFVSSFSLSSAVLCDLGWLRAMSVAAAL